MVETVLTMADIYFSVTQHGKKSGTEAEKKVTREKQLGKFENLCRDASLTEKGARTRIKTLREYALKMPVYVRRDARMEAGEDLWTMMVAYGVREAEKGYNEQNDAEDFWNDHCKQLGMVDWDLAARKADEACVGCKTHGRTCEYASYNSKQKGCRACLLRGDCCDMPRLSSDELEERDVVMSISAPVSSPHRHDSISQGIGSKRKRVEDAISPSKPRRPPPEHSSDDDDDMPMQVVSISPAKPPRKHTGKKKKEPALQAMDVDPSTSSTIIARTDIAPSKTTPKLKALQPKPAKETLKLSAPPEIPPKKKRTKQPSVSIEIVGPAEESQYAAVVKQITANSSKLLREEFDPDWLDGIRTLVKDLSTTCLERIREDYLDVWVGIVAIGIWEELNVDKWDPPKKWQIETSNLSICHAELSKWDAVPFVVPEEHSCKHCPPGKCQYISRSSSRYKGHKCRMCFLKNLPPCLPGAKPRNSVASALSSSIIADAARDEAQGSVVKSAKSKSDASASTTDVDVDMVSDSEKGDDGDEDVDANGKEVDEESSEDYKRIQNVLQNAPSPKFKDRKWLSSIQRRLLKLAVQEQELIRVEFTDVWVQIVLMDLGRAACSEDNEALQKMKLKGSRIRHVDLTQFDLHARAVEEPCASCPEGGKCQYVDVSGILYKGRKCRMCFLMKRVCSLPKRQKQEESDMEVEDEEVVEEVVDVDVVMKSVRKSKNAKEKEKEQARGKEKEKEQTKEREKESPTKTKPSKPKRPRGVEESPLSISNWTSLSNPPPAPVEETPPPVDEDSAPASPTPQSPLFSSTSQSPQHVVTPTHQYTFPQLGQASPPSSWSRMLLDSPPRREMSPRVREEPETPYPRRLSNPPRPLQESPFTTKQLVDSPTRQVVDSPTRQESRGFPLPPSGPPPLTISCNLPTPSSSRDHSGSSSRQPSDSSSRAASGSSSRRPSAHDHRGSSSHASGPSNTHEFPAPPYPHTRPIATSAPEQAFPLPPPPPRLSWTKAGPSSGQSSEDLSKTERYFGRTHASQPSSHDGHSPGSRHDPRSPASVHRSPSHRSPSRRDGPSSVPHQQYDTDLSIRYHLEKEVKMKEVEIAQRDEALRVRDAEVESLRRELDTMKAAWARKEEEVARAEKEKEQALSRVRFIESGIKVLLQPAQDIM